ncbi:MAG: ABC transporter ATP-binding protein [Bacillota bacterium]
MAEVDILIDGVVCSYGSHPVISGLSLQVERGDFLGIIGPNGSGKTTLLRTMARVLQPSAGKVVFMGKDVYRMSARELARKMAVLGQEHGAEYDFTVHEVVLMGRTPHLGRFQGERRHDLQIAERAMSVTNVLHLKDRLITELSGGERQRVLIARALAQEPEVLLLDEPTAHLDVGHQTEILSIIRRLNATSHLTVIGVFHDLNLASEYCDKLVLLDRGRIRALGDPFSVLTAENISAAYGSTAVVSRHPFLPKPHVLVLPRKMVERPGGQRVHLVAGGGSGTALMERISLRGLSLSVGVINEGDSDWLTARSLGARIISVPAFAPVTARDAEELEAIMIGARLVTVAEVPFGHGNLLNLRACLTMSERGIPVVCIGDASKVAERDYTGGKAARLFSQLQERGARFIEATAFDALLDGISAEGEE